MHRFTERIRGAILVICLAMIPACNLLLGIGGEYREQDRGENTSSGATTSGAASGGMGGTGAGGAGGCSLPSDCPDPQGDCMTPTCIVAICGTQIDDTDVDDGNDCTTDSCSGGVPSHQPVAGGSPCEGGSKLCTGNGVCVECITGNDCASGICNNTVCAPPACDDNMQNGDETDVDCGGGTCPGCVVGQNCVINEDCANNNCSPALLKCQ